MIQAEHQIRWAWDERGSGWASEVMEKGWEGFHKHGEAARGPALEAYRMEPTNPEPCRTMMSVVHAADDPDDLDPEVWFERGLEAQFDFMRLWENYMGNWLLPRWGGSHAAMYQVGLRALQSARFDTAVPIVYLETLIQIARDRKDDFRFLRSQVDWDDIEFWA